MRWPLLLPVLALPIGYLLGWFFYGVSVPWMALVLLLGGLGFALLGSGDSGGSRFFGQLVALLLIAGILWGIGGIATLVLLMLSNASGHINLSWTLVLVLSVVILAAMGLAFSLLVALGLTAQRSGGRLFTVNSLTPWLFIAGVLLFAFFPAVRVDCRGMRQDSFLQYSSGFSGAVGQNYWGRKLHLIPDRAELPDDFRNPYILAAAIRCDQDAQGRRRPLSFRASSPLIAVRLSETLKVGSRTHYAVFTPGDHRKLTHWTRGPWQTLERHWPYFNPLWEMPLYFSKLPAAVEQQLPH